MTKNTINIQDLQRFRLITCVAFGGWFFLGYYMVSDEGMSPWLWVIGYACVSVICGRWGTHFPGANDGWTFAATCGGCVWFFGGLLLMSNSEFPSAYWLVMGALGLASIVAARRWGVGSNGS